jgi:hypothetical protein
VAEAPSDAGSVAMLCCGVASIVSELVLNGNSILHPTLLSFSATASRSHMADFDGLDLNLDFNRPRKQAVQWVAVAPPLDPRVEANNR